MAIVYTIDKDHNGYVTRVELDDILKLNYAVLKDKNIDHVINQFGSIQNKILIDYKAFNNWIKDEI